MTRYQEPGADGLSMAYQPRYDHWIGGGYVRPQRGRYFENPTPVTGRPFTEVARGTAEDVERALDAAHGAAPAWGRTPTAERAAVLDRVADRMRLHREELAVAETWETGRPVRETLAADLPLAIDQFRYSAGALRVQQGTLSEPDGDTVAYRFREPLGVVGQLVGWTHPVLLAARTLAPALAAGNAVVLKPAEQAPASLHYWLSLVADLLPPGVVNIVNGLDPEAGRPLATSPRLATVADAGPEPGGRSLTLFFADVSDHDDDLYDRALDGFTRPSRALIEQRHYRSFLADAVARTRRLVVGHPLDTGTTVGAQVSRDQLDRTLAYLAVGVAEGATVLAGGARADLGGELAGGYFVQPTVFEGASHLRVFQDEIVGPVVLATPFTDLADAVKAANDTRRHAGATVWTRDLNTAHRAGRAIQADRIWTNPHHTNDHDRATLDRYQRTKELLVGH
jgi:aldehyde dehydrogenase